MRIRKVLEKFQPYEWEPSSEEIAREVGVPTSSIIRLDTNTSPFIPEKWLKELKNILTNLPVNQYPDTKYKKIREALAGYCNVSIDNITMTNGADEAIDIVAKTFINYQDKVIISVPTYSMFRIAVEICGGKVVEVNRKENPPFEDNIYEIIRIGREKGVSAVFLCNPNNPTGNSVEVSKIKEIADELSCAIVVDEAYYEFSGKSAIKLIKDYPNIIIVRTLSKAFSLAGARIGYIVADKDTISKLNLVRPPNSLSVISLALGEIALSDIEQMKEWVKRIVSERERCFKALKEMNGVKPYQSDANFILFKILNKDADMVYKKLMKKGLIIRNLSKTKGLENCLRFNISTKENNDLFLRELSRVV